MILYLFLYESFQLLSAFLFLENTKVPCWAHKTNVRIISHIKGHNSAHLNIFYGRVVCTRLFSDYAAYENYFNDERQKRQKTFLAIIDPPNTRNRNFTTYHWILFLERNKNLIQKSIIQTACWTPQHNKIVNVAIWIWTKKLFWWIKFIDENVFAFSVSLSSR